MGNRIHGQRGFWTIELIVASFLGALIMIAGLHHTVSQQSALRDQSQRVNLQNMGRGILELFAREIRMAGLDPTCAQSFEGVAQAGPTLIQVKSDRDGSGVIEGGNEDLIYALQAANGSLSRSQGGVTDELIDGVTVASSGMRYFDGDGNELIPEPELDPLQRAAVRRIRIELALKLTAGSEGAEVTSMRFATDVNLRSRFLLKNTACS